MIHPSGYSLRGRYRRSERVYVWALSKSRVLPSGRRTDKILKEDRKLLMSYMKTLNELGVINHDELATQINIIGRS